MGPDIIGLTVVGTVSIRRLRERRKTDNELGASHHRVTRYDHRLATIAVGLLAACLVAGNLASLVLQRAPAGKTQGGAGPMPLFLIWIAASAASVVVPVWWLLRRRRGKPRGRLLSSLAVVGFGYVAALVLAFAWNGAWRDEARWRNGDALAALPPIAERALSRDWTAERIAERLKNRDTLVLVALSGGGSRAAYFDAAILEQLSKIKVPGIGGQPVSLVQRIDLLSTISGGSIAGAYFAAYRPENETAGEAELAEFFIRFKNAMATDFEHHMADNLTDLRHWSAFLYGARSLADSLADAIDQRLFGGTQLRYAELLDRERKGGPLLIVNATMLRDFGLLAFTPDKGTSRRLYEMTQRPGVSGLSTEAMSTRDYRFTPNLASFGDAYGELPAFRVSDAVAASASYPFLGYIRLGPASPATLLSDGGLVDNSGLLSLYAHVFRRSVFKAAEGRLKRIVVIAVDAGGAGGVSLWPLNFAFGIYDQAQENVQRFILPEMIRRAVEQDLADLLARPAWEAFDFPRPHVLNYAQCRASDQPISTRLRLSEEDRRSLDKAALNCVDGIAPGLVSQIAGGIAARYPRYRGILGPGDRSAWLTLLRLANAERRWRREHGKWATIDEVASGEMQASHPREGRYRVKLEFSRKRELAAEKSGFRFESEISGDELRLYATPLRHKDSGWVSMVVTLNAEAPETEPPPDPPRSIDSVSDALAALAAHTRRIEEKDRKRWAEDLRFCMDLPLRFRGGDLAGRRASGDAPVFIPYGFHAHEPCL